MHPCMIRYRHALRMRPEVSVLLLISWLVVFATVRMKAQENTARSSPHKTYRDPAHGVRFTYPATWELSDGMQFYLGTAILDSADGPAKALAAVGFYGGSGDGYRPYPHSNLSGIQFVHTDRPAADQTACEQIAKNNLEDEQKSNIIIHGVRYVHLSGGEAGLGHNATRDVHAAYRSGQCYLFEQDIHGISPDVEPGEKLLTKNTEARLHVQLQDVMQSVHMEQTVDSKVKR